MSENLWGDFTELEEVKNPLDLLKEQNGYLMDSTNNVIFADLRNRTPIPYIDEPETEFATIYSLKSKMLEKYEFQLFVIYYNITFYPMVALLDENVAEAVGVSSTFNIPDEKEFKEFLKLALGNEYTRKIVSSIYAMSK